MNLIKAMIKRLANSLGFEISRYYRIERFDKGQELEFARLAAQNGPNQPVSFSIIVSTVYGQMLINRNDINQTECLVKTGRGQAHAEVEFLRHVIRSSMEANPVVMDVGANIGVFSLGLAPVVGPCGKIYTFEPQRIIFNMLAGSVAVNSIMNIHLFNMAVGDHMGTVELPQFDYAKPLNFGSIEFGSEQREPLTQVRGHDEKRVEQVVLTTLDRFALPRVDLIKIDVEGMEIKALDGASETITRCRPILYVEHLKSDKDALRQRIAAFDYAVYLHGDNFVCLPSERCDKIRAQVGSAI